jgi:hypothetical protein
LKGRFLPGDHGLRSRHRLASSQSSTIWFVGVTLWGAAAAILYSIHVSPLYRAPVSLTFLLVCPGLAIVRLIRVPDTLLQLMLAIALSLALDVLVPSLLLYSGAWSPMWALIILVALAVTAAAAETAMTLASGTS